MPYIVTKDYIIKYETDGEDKKSYIIFVEKYNQAISAKKAKGKITKEVKEIYKRLTYDKSTIHAYIGGSRRLPNMEVLDVICSILEIEKRDFCQQASTIGIGIRPFLESQCNPKDEENTGYDELAEFINSRPFFLKNYLGNDDNF